MPWPFPGETRTLNAAARAEAPGRFLELPDGAVHYELDGETSRPGADRRPVRPGAFLRRPPSGLAGVLMAGVFGYLMGKSMVETRGFFWAWSSTSCKTW